MLKRLVLRLSMAFTLSFALSVQAQPDPYSYANFDQVITKHLDLNLTISFEDKSINGTATHKLERMDLQASSVIFDTKDLTISSVETAADNGEWSEANHSLGEFNDRFGAALTVQLREGDTQVRIHYAADDRATGIQWLTPDQTGGKQYPFMYSQSQAIHARTWIPIQDSPSVRQSYTATVHTPDNLRAVMSAGQDIDAPRQNTYSFNMPQPIPAYLLAIAVGDLEFKAISKNVGIFAEPDVLDAAVYEFADTPNMIKATEKLYGPYLWERYDLLILPPSFPFGGMENPRLSFITPTVLAGDRSLVSLIAHELAHSWSGNLVTNANWNDLWLNEGFTSYVENRVMEELYGRDRAAMELVLGLADMEDTIASLDPAQTTLISDPSVQRTTAAVTYSKGQFFLIFLEERYGRENFDPFLKSYFDHFAFQSVTTTDFLNYLEANLSRKFPNAATQEEINEWVYGTGLPSTTPRPTTPLLDTIENIQSDWLSNSIRASDIDASNWSAQEWLHFITTLPEPMTVDQLAELDAVFNLTQSTNNEIAFAWLMLGLTSGYGEIDNRVETYLSTIGRVKLIAPLYAQLMTSDKGRDMAKRVYAQSRKSYHPIAQGYLDGIVNGEN